MTQHHAVRLLRLLSVPAALWACLAACTPAIDSYQSAARQPSIDPDYSGATIPPNIAPLNFTVEEPGTEYVVEISAAAGRPIRIASAQPGIRIPAAAWRELLARNRGRELHIDVYARHGDDEWVRYDRIANPIAPHDVDGYLAYRLLKPLYNKYVSMGIYQRDLASFDEKALLENERADRACLNCHTFPSNRPDPFLLHTRSRHGLTMLLARGDTVSTVATRTAFNPSPAAYSSWHPSQELVAFSVNRVSLFFHTVGETRDVFDAASDLALYLIDANTLTTTPEISRPHRAEVWPTWSPDGRYLYFSSAPILPIQRYSEVRYDLMRISYDWRSGDWGELETVLAAAETGLSITQPRISPDGHFLLFCMAEYGSFPVYLTSSDLYLMDLDTGGYRRLAVNSDQSDSWHSWSSDGRWIAFSSKRRNALMARPYLSYVDEGGKVHKPILLPQEDPAFYDSFIKTYNVPELITGPVRTSPGALAQAVVDPALPLTARLDPRVQARITAGR